MEVTTVPKKRGRRPKYLTLKMNENKLVENTVKEPTVKKKEVENLKICTLLKNYHHLLIYKVLLW